LERLCGRIAAATHAAGVQFAATTAAGVNTIAGAGVSVSDRIVERVIALEQPILPHASNGAIEGGAPVRYAGAMIGVIAARWTLGRELDGHGAAPLLLAAAAAGAPALLVAAEQQRLPVALEWPDLLGISPGMQAVRETIERAATAPFAVLIEGESGVGKEVVARALHRRSLRRDRPWYVLNCAAIPDDLVESELFGHARGAFTGALADRIGAFEAAHTGTLFLDEVGELSLRAQAKLLRAIQEGEIRRVGDNAVRRIDVRLIAATNRNLSSEVEAGRFRLDLLYRLDVVRIVVPPLRERREDVPVLVDRFWRDARERVSSRAALGGSAVAALARYDWPGNVRELQNVLSAVAVRCPARGIIGSAALPSRVAGAPVNRPLRLDEARRAFDASFVRDALARAGGRHCVAAADLGLSRQGLAKLLERLGVGAGR
jgi:transcriptional regulator with GAF, ATPase, and Fis domain